MSGSGITIKTSATFNNDIELKAATTTTGQNDKKKAEIKYIDGVSSRSAFNYTYSNDNTRLIMSVNNQNEKPGAIQLLNILPDSNTVQYALAPIRSDENRMNNRMGSYKLGLPYNQKDDTTNNRYSYRWDRIFVIHAENYLSDTLLKTNKKQLGGNDISYDNIRHIYENLNVYRADGKPDVDDTNTETEFTIVAQELQTAINGTNNNNLDFLIEESSDEQTYDSGLGDYRNLKTLCPNNINYMNTYMIKTLLNDPIINGSFTLRNNSTNKTQLLNINSSGAFEFGADSTGYGTAGQILQSQGNSASPIWSTITAQNNAYMLRVSTADSTLFTATTFVDLTVAGALTTGWVTDFEENLPSGATGFSNDTLTIPRTGHYQIDIQISLRTNSNYDLYYGELRLTDSNNNVFASDRFSLRKGTTADSDDVAEISLSINTIEELQQNTVLKLRLEVQTNDSSTNIASLRSLRHTNVWCVKEIPTSLFAEPTNTALTSATNNDILQYNSQTGLWNNTNNLSLSGQLNYTDTTSLGSETVSRINGSLDGTDGGQIQILTKPDTSGSSLTERITIKEDGNVGIGTTNPQNLLDVNGNINSTSATFTNFNISGSGTTNNKTGTSTLYNATITGNYDETNQGYIEIDKLKTLTGQGRTGLTLKNSSNGGGASYFSQILMQYNLDISIEHSTGSVYSNWGNINLNTPDGSVRSNSNTVTSDDRIKHNEVNIINGLDIVRQLVPQKYHKTNEIYEENYNGENYRIESGFIAQDILKIPDLTYCVSGGDYIDENNNNVTSKYYLAYQDIFVYGMAATKELDTIVQNQQTTINELNTKITNLEAENTSLKEENILIKSKLNEILTEMGKETI